MREVPFDFLPPLPLHPLAPLSPNAPPVAIHRFLFCLLAIPVARSPIWFRDVSSYPQFAQAHRNLVAVVSLVRHHFFHSTSMHRIFAFRRFHRHQFRHRHARFNHRLFHSRRVGGGSIMRRDRDDGSGLHVHCILRFIRQRSASVPSSPSASANRFRYSL